MEAGDLVPHFHVQWVQGIVSLAMKAFIATEGHLGLCSREAPSWQMKLRRHWFPHRERTRSALSPWCPGPAAFLPWEKAETSVPVKGAQSALSRGAALLNNTCVQLYMKKTSDRGRKIKIRKKIEKWVVLANGHPLRATGMFEEKKHFSLMFPCLNYIKQWREHEIACTGFLTLSQGAKSWVLIHIQSQENFSEWNFHLKVWLSGHSLRNEKFLLHLWFKIIFPISKVSFLNNEVRMGRYVFHILSWNTQVSENELKFTGVNKGEKEVEHDLSARFRVLSLQRTCPGLQYSVSKNSCCDLY